MNKLTNIITQIKEKVETSKKSLILLNQSDLTKKIKEKVKNKSITTRIFFNQLNPKIWIQSYQASESY